jgi:hypothetical protein
VLLQSWDGNGKSGAGLPSNAVRSLPVQLVLSTAPQIQVGAAAGTWEDDKIGAGQALRYKVIIDELKCTRSTCWIATAGHRVLES